MIFYLLLFILVINALSWILGRAVEDGLLSEYMIGNPNAHNVRISHLTFTDDTIIFCDTEEVNLRNLSLLLLCFESVSGMHINVGKCEIIFGKGRWDCS